MHFGNAFNRMGPVLPTICPLLADEPRYPVKMVNGGSNSACRAPSRTSNDSSYNTPSHGQQERSSVDVRAAVDVVGGTGDVAGLFAAQVGDEVSDVVHVAVAADR